MNLTLLKSLFPIVIVCMTCTEADCNPIIANDVNDNQNPSESTPKGLWAKFKNKIHGMYNNDVMWPSTTVPESIQESLIDFISTKPKEKVWTEIISNPDVCDTDDGKDIGCTAECIKRKNSVLNYFNSISQSRFGFFSTVGGTIIEDETRSVYECVKIEEAFKCRCTHCNVLQLNSKLLQHLLPSNHETGLSTRSSHTTRIRHGGGHEYPLLFIIFYPVIWIWEFFRNLIPHTHISLPSVHASGPHISGPHFTPPRISGPHLNFNSGGFTIHH